MTKPKRNAPVKVAFDDWFSRNYQALKNSMKAQSEFNEDAFHDAYLYVISSKAIQPQSEEFRREFIIAYNALSKKHFSDSFVLCHPDEIFFALLPDSSNDEIPAADYTQAKTISSFIHATFSDLQETIFQMRVKGVSIRNTADALGLNTTQVKDIYQSVQSKTQARFAMAL
jgi:DNA-directed RNA polymerase specialized sigma24 family protein